MVGRNVRTVYVMRWVSRLIIVAGIIWVSLVLVQEWHSIREQFHVRSSLWLGLSVVGGVVALLTTSPIFQHLLGFYGNQVVSLKYAARLLFVGQVLRHIPGRVWGILYQINETSHEFCPMGMVRANIDFMILSMTFHLLTSVMLYVFFLKDLSYSLGLAAVGMTLMTLFLRNNWIGIIFSYLARYLPTRVATPMKKVERGKRMPWNRVSSILFLFSLFSSLYLFVWYAFSKTFPGLEQMNIWLLCAAYSLAWVIGYISIVTPGGLGVREAVFLTLAVDQANPESVAFLAVFVRIWQVSVELLLFIFFFFVKPSFKATTTQ